MLSASTGFKNAISASNRKYDIKVEITRNDVGSSPINISDRVISYQCTHDFESRNGRLSLEIDNYDYQLSPMNRTSSLNLRAGIYDPLFDSNHKVELYEGVKVNGVFEYVKKFEGYLGDDIQASSSPTLSLSCRDKSKLLQDTYIYQGPSYSLMLVEDVIQDLLKEFVPHLNITLQVLNPTKYMIGRPDGPYTAKEVNLWDAIQLLADSASQELRFLEDGSLVLRKIDRDFGNKPANINLDLSSLISDSMGISDADVRNHIVIKVQGYDTITKKDDASIAKYGRRYMEVHRSMSDIITNVEQAHELGQSILRDLRYANPNETAEIALHPLIQVGDIVKITNPRLGTNATNDTFKIVSISNAYSKDRKRTNLQLKGYDSYLEVATIPPKQATGLTSVMQERRISNYPGSGWNGYEKSSSFPMIKWTPPTQLTDNSAIPVDFGGYVIERATQVDKGKVTANWYWGTIASIPSYLPSTGTRVDYFYDYSVASELQKYITAGATGTTVTLKYRVTAINKQGSKSAVSSELSVVVPYDKVFNQSGVQI